jgi:hypothetical protein
MIDYVKKNKKHIQSSGFIMPLTLILVTLILTVSSGITTIIGKELFFSRLQRDSNTAYYVADTAMECATFLDDTFLNGEGLGIFEYPPFGINTATSTLNFVNLSRQSSGIPTILMTDIRCAAVPIFNSDITSFSVEEGEDPDGAPSVISSYTMMMGAGDGEVSCAKVTVNKTASWRQIIARGFNTCNFGAKNVLERAIVSTSER